MTTIRLKVTFREQSHEFTFTTDDPDADWDAAFAEEFEAEVVGTRETE